MRSFYWTLFLTLVIGNIYVYQTIFASPMLRVSILSVGKGDAILVQSPSGKTLLIDAGRDASILRALGSALPMWQRRIDAAIITSKASASSGGLPDVMARYRIETLVRSGTRGERFLLGDGAYVDILWPPPTAVPMNTTNGALVLRISYGTTSFLIQNNLPPRISAWLAVLDAHIPPSNVIISSSTPAGVYTSNGKGIK